MALWGFVFRTCASRCVFRGGPTYILDDMVRHFSQANEFSINFVRDGDAIVSDFFACVENQFGTYNEIRPPA
eukprot:3263581-Alexandrium_andersonii.AAC.1